MRDGSWTRRSVLAAGTGIVLAGCAGRSGPSSRVSADGDVRTTSGGGVFEDISFDDGSMVVRLREGHDVSQVNLIAPDGTSFAQARVPIGATTVRMVILDIEPLGIDYEHYQPGIYELVAVSDSHAESRRLELVPNLEISAVEYRSSQSSRPRLLVKIINTGTAPTWAYEITYKYAPNYTANGDLSDSPGIPLFSIPSDPTETILDPGEERYFAGMSRPLLFRNEPTDACVNKTFEFIITVGAAGGGSPSQRVRLVTGGRPVSSGLTGQYVCSEAAVLSPDTDNADV